MGRLWVDSATIEDGSTANDRAASPWKRYRFALAGAQRCATLLLDTAFTTLSFSLSASWRQLRLTTIILVANRKLPAVSLSCLFSTRHAQAMRPPWRLQPSPFLLRASWVSGEMSPIMIWITSRTTTTSLPRIIQTIPLRATRFRPIHLLLVLVAVLVWRWVVLYS